MELISSCISCGGQQAKLVYASKAYNITKDDLLISSKDYGRHLPIVECKKCHLWFVPPRHIPSNLIDCYAEVLDDEYEHEIEHRSITFQNILKRIESIAVKKGSLLDVGCATGYLVKLAQKRGWYAEGIEPSLWAVEVSKKKHGIKIIQGDVMNLQKPKKLYDAIVTLDVIEHVRNPRAFLKKLRSLMQIGATLCIVTPNKKSLMSRLLRRNWWHIRTAHIFYFDKKILIKLLQEQGFSIKNVRSYTWHFSMKYIFERLGKLPILKYFNMFFLWLSRRSWAKKWVIPICLGDSLEVYAVSN